MSNLSPFTIFIAYCFSSSLWFLKIRKISLNSLIFYPQYLSILLFCGILQGTPFSDIKDRPILISWRSFLYKDFQVWIILWAFLLGFSIALRKLVVSAIRNTLLVSIQINCWRCCGGDFLSFNLEKVFLQCIINTSNIRDSKHHFFCHIFPDL